MNNDNKDIDQVIHPALGVADLLGDTASVLKLTVLQGNDHLTGVIKEPVIQKTGLPLTGYAESIYPGRIQVLGKSEINYINQLGREKRDRNLKKICEGDIPCFIITRGLKPPEELKIYAAEKKLPILSTPLKSSILIDKLVHFLEDKLGPYTNLHGTLVEIYGLGVLLLGESGIGKSECALNLVAKGHRLVTDDVVKIQRKSSDRLMGTGPELTRYHMELRGIGVINIKDLFGVTSVLYEKELNLVVSLEDWDEDRDYDRLGLDQSYMNVLGIDVPWLMMPVAPGRNTAVLVEVAARNQILKNRGYTPAEDLAEELRQRMDDEKE